MKSALSRIMVPASLVLVAFNLFVRMHVPLFHDIVPMPMFAFMRMPRVWLGVMAACMVGAFIASRVAARMEKSVGKEMVAGLADAQYAIASGIIALVCAAIVQIFTGLIGTEFSVATALLTAGALTFITGAGVLAPDTQKGRALVVNAMLSGGLVAALLTVGNTWMILAAINIALALFAGLLMRSCNDTNLSIREKAS